MSTININHFINVADAKAAGFFTASLTVGAMVLTTKATTFWQVLFRGTALISFLGCLIVTAIAIFPRLPSARRGVVFWEDIRSFKGLAEFTQAVMSLKSADVRSRVRCSELHRQQGLDG